MPDQSRRWLLTAGALGAGTVVAGCSTRSGAHTGREPRTFVIVHGSNGNGAAYTTLQTALVLAGHRAVAVDLPGHGPAARFPLSYQAPQDLARLANEPSPLAKVRLADNVEHVAGVVRRVAEYGPVVLVGHSLGGATITRVANEIPHLIARLVYLTAFCCVQLRSVLDCLLTPEVGESFGSAIPGLGDPQKTGVTRVNWRSADPEFLAAAKTTFAEDYDDDTFRSALNILEPDESVAVGTDDARGNPSTWGRIPRSYIRCSRDRLLPLALQDRMIREADAATPGNRFDVHTLDAPHFGPADPQPIADILLSITNR
ncbi:alpha/beta hydrolase [Nocardia australiensis]|uniref:alpha/beta hydrolase n=1 Tax=Nocardia australiensis TaxID=2887191 RepID=UPI001D146EEF|nr:alpha/beta hydrolase [Nocardia australiensis]